MKCTLLFKEGSVRVFKPFHTFPTSSKAEVVHVSAPSSPQQAAEMGYDRTDVGRRSRGAGPGEWGGLGRGSLVDGCLAT